MTGKTLPSMQGKKDPYEKKSTDGSRHMYWNFDFYRRQQVFCSESEMPEAAVCDGHLYGVYRIWKNSEKAVDAAIEEVQKLDAMLSAENSKK